MKNLSLVASLVFCVILTSCGDPAPEGDFSGVLENPNVTEVFLEELLPNDLKPLDTAIIAEDGSFAFKTIIDHIGYYRIKVNNQNYCSLVGKVGDKIHITAKAVDINNTYKVTGSPMSEKFQEVLYAYTKAYQKRDSIQRSYKPTMDSLQVIALSENFDAANLEMSNLVKGVIDADNDPFISQFIIDQLNPDTEIAYYQKLNEVFNAKYPGNLFAENFNFKVQKLLRFAIGTEVPDILLSDRNDTARSLRDLRGNIVLIDFWASWCKPCRAENPNVVRAYNTYHDKGFEVFSVSLDGVPNQPDPKGQWLAAIEQDGLIWENHVSDLKGWGSMVVPMFDIQGIPFTLLVDREGKILGKNLRGPALDMKLEELLGGA